MPDDLTAAWERQVADVRRRVVAVCVRMWRSEGSYRDASARRFADAITPVILAGQVRTAHLTEVYLTQLIARYLAEFRSMAEGVATPESYSRKGTDPADVYRRPFADVWRSLAAGMPLDEAVADGQRRLVSIASTDMQLAKTHAAQRTLTRAQHRTGQPMWYERTLTGAENCAMCVVASTQRYQAAELLPIHPGCDCGMRGHVGHAPNQVIHSDRLEMLHDTLNKELGVSDRAGKAPDYRKIVTVAEHGEYGPTLTIGRHDFKGPEEVS
ncbi:MAG: hypothetical protein ACRDP4_14925, partial [Nocardioidaceae bacterium]